MENTLLRMAIGAAAMSVFFALPSLAMGSVVPPGNSAATQYTETFPTTGGNAEVNSSIDGGGRSPSSKGGGRSPAKVLGSDTAHKLESHGQEGETVATLATESASVTADEGDRPSSAGKGGEGKGANRDNGSDNGTGSGGSGGGGTAVGTPEGSSGLSEVLGHATGSSSGEMGIFLPLVLLAAPLCALLYAWRRRQPGRAAS